MKTDIFATFHELNFIAAAAIVVFLLVLIAFVMVYNALKK